MEFEINKANDRYDAFLKKYGKGAIEKFNADPNNKVKLTKTDVSVLDNPKKTAYANQSLLVENDYIKADIDTKKKLYDDYEAYKLKSGSVAADAEYNDLLRSGKNFSDYLNNLYEATATLEQDYFGDNSGPIEQRQKLIKRSIDDNIQSQKKSFEQLLLDTVTYYEEREAIIQAGNDAENKLSTAGYNERGKQAQKNAQDKLTALDEEKFKQMDAYKSLFDNIDTLSTASANKQLSKLYDIANNSVATGKITVEAYLKVIKTLDKGKETIDSKIPEGLKKIGSELSNLGTLANAFDGELGKALTTIGSMVSGVGAIKQGLSDFKVAQSKNDGFGQIVSSLGILGSAVGIISGVYNLFFDNSKKQAEIQAQNDYRQQNQLKADEAINKALARRLDIYKELYGPGRLDGYLNQEVDLKAKIEETNKKLAGRYSLTGTDKKSDEIITSFNNLPDSQKSSRAIQQLLTALSGFGTIGLTTNLLGKSIEDLQQLLDSKKLDDASASIVNNIIDLNQQLKDTRNLLLEEVTGINLDGLNEKIRAVFDSGEIGAEKFADAIESSIKGAFSNSFKRNEIEKAMQPFYDMLYQSGSDGVFTDDEIKALRASKDAISEELAKRAKVYQDIIGKDGESTESALNKAIQGITSDQANALEGIQRGQYDYTKRIYDLGVTRNSLLKGQYDAIMSGLNNWQAIETNTAQTVVRLDIAITELQKSNATLTKIVTNTNPISGRGAGITL